MKIIDISAPFYPGLPFYPGDPVMTVEPHCEIKKGAGANVSKITFGNHTGTHLDPPRHFFDDLSSIDQIPLERFFGKAEVIDQTGISCITKDSLEGKNIYKGANILFKTDNKHDVKNGPFKDDYVYISKSAAELLVDAGINLVGIDYLSVEQFHGDGTCPAHHLLLGNNILILEGIDLTDVSEGTYTLSALPLNLKDGNGSPCRAVLICN